MLDITRSSDGLDTMAPPQLLAMPAELFDQVEEYLELPDLNRLRSACHGLHVRPAGVMFDAIARFVKPAGLVDALPIGRGVERAEDDLVDLLHRVDLHLAKLTCIPHDRLLKGGRWTQLAPGESASCHLLQQVLVEFAHELVPGSGRDFRSRTAMLGSHRLMRKIAGCVDELPEAQRVRPLSKLVAAALAIDRSHYRLTVPNAAIEALRPSIDRLGDGDATQWLGIYSRLSSSDPFVEAKALTDWRQLAKNHASTVHTGWMLRILDAYPENALSLPDYLATCCDSALAVEPEVMQAAFENRPFRVRHLVNMHLTIDHTALGRAASLDKVLDVMERLSPDGRVVDIAYACNGLLDGDSPTEAFEALSRAAALLTASSMAPERRRGMALGLMFFASHFANDFEPQVASRHLDICLDLAEASTAEVRAIAFVLPAPGIGVGLTAGGEMARVLENCVGDDYRRLRKRMIEAFPRLAPA